MGRIFRNQKRVISDDTILQILVVVHLYKFRLSLRIDSRKCEIIQAETGLRAVVKEFIVNCSDSVSLLP